MAECRYWRMSGFNSVACLAGLVIILGFLSSRGYSIMCYHCNSQFDPRCGDPFDDYSIGRVNCSKREKPEHLTNVSATLCRKNVQKVYGKIRVVRSCGYIEDKQRDDKACAKRTGTHDVHIDYCSCTTDLCNVGSNLKINPSHLLLSLFIGLTFGFNSFKFYEMYFTSIPL